MAQTTKIKPANFALFIWPQITPRSLNKTKNPDPERNGFEIGGTLDPGELKTYET